MKNSMFAGFLAVALIGAASASAGDVYNAKNYKCEDLKALVNQNGSVQISSGLLGSTETYYSAATACGDLKGGFFNYYQANFTYIPTMDSAMCGVGFTCVSMPYPNGG